jgi:farnesyl diphosphate synthase
LDFDYFLKQHQTRISSYLNEILPDEKNNILHQAMRYSVLNGGKRLRPILVYAAGLALHGNPKNLDTSAAAVELIHCYSLIHDDLPAMDNADLRRGKPTCHKKFNEAIAILAGDALQALSFEILSRNNQMSSILSQTCLYIAEGQAQDIANQTTISLEKLNHINQLKTGALIEASVLLGATSANCQNQKILDALKKYAQNIGLAFQIHDDILDIESTTKTLGKPTQSDQTLNKPTYPALIGVTQAKQKLQQLHQQAIECLNKINLENSLLADLANFVITRHR